MSPPVSWAPRRQIRRSRTRWATSGSFRRKKISTGLGLNARKAGLSLSFGPRGAKVTVGPRGVRRTFGVPGTGLSYTSTSRRRRKVQATSDGTGLGYLVVLVIAIALIAAFWQYLVLIAVGGLGIGLIWWARRRGRSAMPGIADPQAMLTELGDLHAAGVLTDAEFQAKKATIPGSTQADSNDLASRVSERLDWKCMERLRQRHDERVVLDKGSQVPSDDLSDIRSAAIVDVNVRPAAKPNAVMMARC